MTTFVQAFAGGEAVVFRAGAGEEGMVVEEAAQEVQRQEAAFGAYRLEFLVGARYLGQCFGSARSGRIGTYDTQPAEKWFIFEVMWIVV